MQIRLSDGSIIEAIANIDPAGNIVTPGQTASVQPIIIKSLATVNLLNLKSTAGRVYGVQMCNTGAAWVYLKMYDSITLPILANDLPKMIIGIPPGGRCEINRPAGVIFTNGVSIAIVGGVIDTDATAIGLSQVVGTIDII